MLGRMGRWIGGVLVLAALTAAAPARADEEQACLPTKVAAEAWRATGNLSRARDTFAACAEAPCVETRAACRDGMLEVARAMPHLALRAMDVDGRDYVDVEVLLDGRTHLLRLDGLALPVDPGLHHVVFLAADGATGEETVFVKERETALVRVVLTGATARPPSTAPRSTPAWHWILDASLLGVGGALLVGSIIGLVASGSVWMSLPLALGSGAVVGGTAALLADLAPGTARIPLTPAIGWMGRF